MTTGKKDREYRIILVHLCLLRIMRTIVAENDIIIIEMERNRNVNPNISLLGREFLKSISRNGAVRIERNITTAIKANVRESTSVPVKTKNKGSERRTGRPVL